MEPIDAELFESSQTPLLDTVRIPDRVWRRILELLSLSRPGKQGRGRISYAQLGVNQLGAVYEGLLSYTGFFAREEMVEVKRAQDSNPDMLDRAWFVPKTQIGGYEESEIVYDGNEPRIYPAGTFIYRLTGYGREEGASYYTPETLTRSTVKYALQQLTIPSADHVLGIRICEPAMGSAAFLIEAVNQLTDLYLEKKQQELQQTIAPDDLIRERQRVRTYITARNAFGVDINPVAQELGQISLWLNCMEPQGNRPDFNRTLHVGNSLIGARREVVIFQENKSRWQLRDQEGCELPFGKNSQDWRDIPLSYTLCRDGDSQSQGREVPGSCYGGLGPRVGSGLQKAIQPGGARSSAKPFGHNRNPLASSGAMPEKTGDILMKHNYL